MDYGDFVWLERITDDPDATISFYRDVVGWNLTDMEMSPGTTYTMFAVGDEPVAGIITDAPSPAVPNSWLGYIACHDLERTTERARDMNAEVLGDITSIDSGGRFDVMRDPGGGIFAAFEPETLDDMSEISGDQPGRLGWCELYSRDPDASMDMFTQVFGWDEGGSMTMDSGALYRMFNNGAADFGGIMDVPKMDNPPPVGWNFYFSVDDLDAACSRAKDRNANILVGPMEIPGGSRVVVMFDHEGALVSLVGE